MLREVHHLLGNSMQMISSLLYLHGRGMRDHAARAVLDRMHGRVRAMSLAHKLLYQSEVLDVREYVEGIVVEVARSFPGDVSVSTDVAPLAIRPDAATPFGLVLYELTSNALAHAFPDGRHGTVLVSLRAIDEEIHELRVADDGIGLPPDQGTDTPGLTMVTRLVDQLQGELVIERGSGTTVVVRAKLVARELRQRDAR